MRRRCQRPGRKGAAQRGEWSPSTRQINEQGCPGRGLAVTDKRPATISNCTPNYRSPVMWHFLFTNIKMPRRSNTSNENAQRRREVRIRVLASDPQLLDMLRYASSIMGRANVSVANKARVKTDIVNCSRCIHVSTPTKCSSNDPV